MFPIPSRIAIRRRRVRKRRITPGTHPCHRRNELCRGLIMRIAGRTGESDESPASAAAFFQSVPNFRSPGGRDDALLFRRRFDGARAGVLRRRRLRRTRGRSGRAQPRGRQPGGPRQPRHRHSPRLRRIDGRRLAEGQRPRHAGRRRRGDSAARRQSRLRSGGGARGDDARHRPGPRPRRGGGGAAHEPPSGAHRRLGGTVRRSGAGVDPLREFGRLPAERRAVRGRGRALYDQPLLHRGPGGRRASAARPRLRHQRCGDGQGAGRARLRRGGERGRAGGFPGPADARPGGHVCGPPAAP